LLLPALLLMPGVSLYAQIEGVGFQARLIEPSHVVSAYDKPDTRFSAAMYPRSYDVLHNSLIFTPKVRNHGSFDQQAITFDTRVRGEVDLVPVSADAAKFLEYRTRSRINQRWAGFATNTLLQIRQTGRRNGLSIGVALPKRFDQMFGEGGANLRVSGYRRITFSGRSQWDDAAGSGVRRQNKFPSLNMEQLSRFTIQGTIGTKITVSVTQDNQTDIPLANRLILRYKGDDDDVLRTIEAGNTNLSIPNTRFVGYSQRIQGLFGIKTEAQLGNLKLTAIASQEKGSSESAVVSATGEENADFVRDYSYAEGRIFDLAYPGEIGPHDSVRVWLYEEEPRQDNPDAEEVYLRAGPEDPHHRFDVTTLLMKDITGEGYQLLYGQDSTHCPVAIVFFTGRRRALGVYMEITRNNPDGSYAGRIDTIGFISSGLEMDTLRILQTVSKDNLPSHPAWKLMWRNCYRIPRNVAIEDIDIKVYKGLSGREGTTSSLDYQQVGGVSQDPYIKILGLDQWNNLLQRIPDGKLDGFPEVYREDWGLLIFPEREPFNSNRTFEDANGERSDTLVEKTPLLYNYLSTDDKIKSSKYYLQISTKARSATIRLGRANVIEGSERVTLNGQVLSKGTDYNISYDMGQVTLLTDEATDPNADVQVEFQYAPFMTLQKKTLFGTRAEFEYNQDLKLGATVLYKSDKAQERKPRVGQETAKAMVMDFDVSFALHPNFLTRMVDALPLVSTEAASRLRVTAEIAQSRPNPNIDGVAYVDDFESAVELVSLGTVRTNWTLASEPLGIDPLYVPERSGDTWTRGTIRWHNPPTINRETVYQGKTVAGQGAMSPLRLFFRPHGYKYSGPSDDPCRDSIPSKSWGGIMRPFARRIDEKRILTFEVRAKGGRGVLHFDFGRISEDLNGNGKQEDEDLSYPPNNTLDIDLNANPPINEDVGLDTTADEYEFDRCLNGYDPNDNPDPAGDNWWYEGYGKGFDNNSRPPVSKTFWDNNPDFRNNVNDPDHWLHYEWQNGTEGNIDDDAVQGRPDDEALFRSSFELNNAYFTFELDLDTIGNPFLVQDSSFNGWYTYQVPVRDTGIVDTLSDGQDVSWANVTHVRVWFEKDSTGVDSLASMDSVWIANWGFVQSGWHDTLITSESDLSSDFYTASVSEDDGTFVHPPGVEPYVDPVTNIEEPQRGLALKYESLQSWAEGVARKELFTTESYSGYRRLEMYVHGDESLTEGDSLMFYFRLGLDSNNFYEYRTYLKAGWSESNHVKIDFNEMTALKDAAERALDDRRAPLEDSSAVYRVVGRPNINEIRFVSASVQNHDSDPLSGEVWIDELRVTDVRKDVGTAARLQVKGSLADLLTYNFNYEHRNAFFRGLSQATRGGSKNNLGSGKETNMLSFGGTFNFSKFLPRSWSVRVPLSFGYSENETIPLLRTNSDVVLSEDVREQEKTVSRSVKFSASESFQKKGSNFLFSALLNRQKITISYTRSRQKRVNNPLIFAENYNLRAEYNMGVAIPPTLPIFFWTKPIPLLKKIHLSELSLFPTKWKWNATFNRSLQVKDDADYNRTSSFSRTLDGRMDMSYRPFSNLTADFNFRTKRDLTDPDLVNISFRRPRLGIENNYNQDFRLSYDPKLFAFLTSALSYSATYHDNYDRSSISRSTALNRNWSVSGNFMHQMLLGSKKKRRTSATKTPRGTVRGGVREEDEKEKEAGPPFYEPVLDGLRFLTGWLQAFRYRYTEGFNRTIPGVREKLPWKYRLGMDTRAQFPVVSSSKNPSSGESSAYEIGSGFTLLGGITTTVGYKSNTTRSLASVGTDLTESITTSWPEVTLQIRRFTTLPLIKKPVNWFIDIFAPRTNYSRQVKRTVNLDRGFTVNRSETINRNPLISLNLKLLRRLSLSGSYNVSLSIEEKANRSNGLPESETRTTKKSIALSAKYSFSSPGGISIPLIGRLKFKSMVSIDFSVQYSSNLVETSKQGLPFVPFTNQSSFAASPVISYSFSSQIRGGITARWQDTNDLQRHRKTHVREIQLWTEIRF